MLAGKAIALHREYLNLDFILRGAVNCATCQGAYTANWAKVGLRATHTTFAAMKAVEAIVSRFDAMGWKHALQHQGDCTS